MVEKRVLGKEHQSTLVSAYNLPGVLLGQGEFSEAAQIVQETWAVQKRVLGEEHPHTLVPASNLASALLKQGDFSEAERLFRGTLNIRKRVLGEEHPSTVAMSNSLDVVLARLDECSGAAAAKKRKRAECCGVMEELDA